MVPGAALAMDQAGVGGFLFSIVFFLQSLCFCFFSSLSSSSFFSLLFSQFGASARWTWPATHFTVCSFDGRLSPVCSRIRLACVFASDLPRIGHMVLFSARRPRSVAASHVFGCQTISLASLSMRRESFAPTTSLLPALSRCTHGSTAYPLCVLLF